MANQFYISAGLPPNDSGETTAANTFYISAGLVPDDAGGTGVTVSAAAGAVSVTGYNPTITAGTTVDVSTNGLAVAGLAASVSVGTTIQASAGSVSVVGYDASVPAQAFIYCSTGTIVVTGLAADIPGTTISVKAKPKSYTAKSVILDIADNWGQTNYIALRAVDFWYAGAKISLAATDFTAYATSEASPAYIAGNVFDTSLSKIGGTVDTQWYSANLSITNQRLIVVFNTEQTFDEIRINNSHYSGDATTTGAKNVVIHYSTDSITDTTYEASISNSIQLFDGQFDEHSPSNVEDEQELEISSTVSIIALTGYNPTVSTVPDINVNLGTVSIAPYGTEVLQGATISGGIGALVVAPMSVDVSVGTSISCSVAHVSLEGHHAVVAQAVDIDCLAGSLVVASLAVDVVVGSTAECSLGTVSLVGLSVSLSAGVEIECSAGVVSIERFGCSVVLATDVEVGTGTVSVNVFDPTITAVFLINTSLGQVEIGGHSVVVTTLAPVDWRTVKIALENRTLIVEYELRSVEIPFENRTYEVKTTN